MVEKTRRDRFVVPSLVFDLEGSVTDLTVFRKSVRPNWPSESVFHTPGTHSLRVATNFVAIQSIIFQLKTFN